MQLSQDDLSTSSFEISARAVLTGKLTLADRHDLRSVLLDASLNETDLAWVDRLLRSIRRGHVLVLDESSPTR